MKNILKNENRKYALLGFLCIIIYFSIKDLELIFFGIFNINYDEFSLSIKVVYSILWETIIMCSIIFLLSKQLTKNFKDLKKNHKEYFKKYFKFWLISVAIMMVSNVFITLITGSELSSNESTLRETFKISPIYIYFSSVIFAPAVEELVFRRSIKNIIRNKYIFILVSGLVFGGLHVIGDFSGPLDLLYLIPYCAPGFAFAYILADSDNVLITIALHLMHNGVLMSLQFILLFFS